MIRKVSALFFPLFLFAMLFLQLSFMGIVKAESAHCFMRSLNGDAAFHSTECSQIAALIQGGPQDNFCYTSSGWSVETRPLNSPDPNTQPNCQEWLGQANATASVPAKCVAVDGSMSDWNDGKIKDLNKYNPNANCADFYGKLTTNGGGDPNTFQNGQCYIIFKAANGKFDFTFYECKNGLQALISHQQVSTTPNATLNTAKRNDVANCGANGETVDACFQKNPIVNLLDIAVNFLAAGVGIVVVVMIIIGGIQYTSAGNNPQTVAAARKKISNALIAFVAFLLVYAFMQWLIPGGIF